MSKQQSTATKQPEQGGKTKSVKGDSTAGGGGKSGGGGKHQGPSTSKKGNKQN